MGEALTLGEIIAALEELPSDATVKRGFGCGESYRGWYDRIAFMPMEEATVGSMLEEAMVADGSVLEGYKGGEYRMDKGTLCHRADWGEFGEPITTADVMVWQLTAAEGGGDGDA